MNYLTGKRWRFRQANWDKQFALELLKQQDTWHLKICSSHMPTRLIHIDTWWKYIKMMSRITMAGVSCFPSASSLNFTKAWPGPAVPAVSAVVVPLPRPSRGPGRGTGPGRCPRPSAVGTSPGGRASNLRTMGTAMGYSQGAMVYTWRP